MDNNLVKSKKFLISIFMLISFFAAQHVLAAPSINANGVVGTVTNNQNITINGSGFGAKAQAAPWFWDTVDNQSAYNGAVDGSCVPISGVNNDMPSGCSQAVAQSAPFQEYMQGLNSGGPGQSTPVIKHTGSMLPNRTSVYQCTQNNGYECGLNGLTKGPASGATQMYASWWLYPNYTNGTDVTSDKICRLVSGIDYDSEVEFVWTTQNSTSIYDHTNGTFQLNVWDGTGWSAPDPHWHFQEALIDSVTNKIWVYSDGNLIGNWTAPYGSGGVMGTIRVAPNNIGSIGLNTNGIATGYQNFGDIYFDKTFQRAEICAGSTFATRGYCQMLLPSMWSSSSITTTINQGSFINGSNAYIFVIDINNVASPSYPITFGQIYSGDIVTYSILNFTSLISNWLHLGTASDLNYDNIVNTKDLGIMMSKWN